MICRTDGTPYSTDLQVLPFVLRRTKDNVLKELPPKTVVDILCPLSTSQMTLYANLQKGLRISDVSLEEALRRGMGVGSDNSTPKSAKPCVNALQAFLYLSLLSIHPSLVVSDAHVAYKKRLLNDDKCSGKLAALARLLLDVGVVGKDECSSRSLDVLYGDEQGRVACHPQTDSGLDSSEDDEEVEADEGLGKGAKGSDRTKSGRSASKNNKIASRRRAANDHKTIVQADEPQPDYLSHPVTPSPRQYVRKCLVFAQHLVALDVVESFVMRRHFPGVRYSRLDGHVAPLDRADVVRDFNEDVGEDSIRVLLLTTASCGLGISLTAADTVVFLEHSWNPFQDAQATDRSHRIGQSRPVTVYRLLGTVLVSLSMFFYLLVV